MEKLTAIFDMIYTAIMNIQKWIHYQPEEHQVKGTLEEALESFASDIEERTLNRAAGIIEKVFSLPSGEGDGSRFEVALRRVAVYASMCDMVDEHNRWLEARVEAIEKMFEAKKTYREHLDSIRGEDVATAATQGRDYKADCETLESIIKDMYESSCPSDVNSIAKYHESCTRYNAYRLERMRPCQSLY